MSKEGHPLKPEAALFLFHLRVGARLALRVLAPVLAVALFFYYILRPEFAIELARILFLEGSLLESGTIGAILLLGLARIVAPRIASGELGWARSLPVARGSLRLSAVVSMVVAQAPLLAALGGLAWVVTAPEPMPATPYIMRVLAHIVRVAPHIVGLIIGASAADLACLQTPAAMWTKLVPIAACFLSFAGNAVGLVASVFLLVLSAVFPGRRVASKKRRGPRRNLPSSAFFLGLSLRAVRGRIVLAYVPPAIVLGLVCLFLANNDLASSTTSAVSLFGLALSLTTFIGTAAGILAARRPAWPWLRSLPRSAAARVRDDGLFLALLALPLAGGIALLRRPAWEAVYLVGPLAWFVSRAAGVMRESSDKPFGVLGRIIVEGTVLSLILALLPWASFVLAAGAPVALRSSRNADLHLKPTLWAELHHSDAGDPLSWGES